MSFETAMEIVHTDEELHVVTLVSTWSKVWQRLPILAFHRIVSLVSLQSARSMPSCTSQTRNWSPMARPNSKCQTLEPRLNETAVQTMYTCPIWIILDFDLHWWRKWTACPPPTIRRQMNHYLFYRRTIFRRTFPTRRANYIERRSI